MSSAIAARLRNIRERRGWTVAEMAARTEIPKRTLDKYMLRGNPVQPGLIPLMSLAKGLGVSLDYLVFGPKHVSQNSYLLTDKAATEVGVGVFAHLLERLQRDGFIDKADERVFEHKPEYWGSLIGHQVAEKVKELASEGVTLEELLEWDAKRKDQMSELVRDEFENSPLFASIKTQK